MTAGRPPSPAHGRAGWAVGSAEPRDQSAWEGGEDDFTTRVLRRMAWRHAVPWLVRGLAAGLAVAAALLLIAHVVPWTGAAWWALAAFCALTLGGAGVALVTRPKPATTLRHADRLLGLRDRLTTAWEFGGRADPMLRLQRDELVARSREIDLRGRLSLRPPRHEALAPALGTCLLLAALLLPNPQNGVLSARTATRAHIQRATTRITTAQRAAAGIPPTTTAALTKADKLRQAQIARALARLQKELASARTSAQAYKALARAQDTLKALGNPRAAAQRAALAAMAAALAHNPAHSAAAQALAAALRSGNPSAIAQAAKRLAAALAKQSPADRAALARALQAAAQAAGANSAASASLQQAATALAQGDQAGAQSALQQAGQQAAADAAGAAQQAALDKTNAALDSARNDVSGLSNDGSSGPSGQAAGKSGATTGQSGSAGKGGSGKGAGSQGNQPGQGQGNGAGQGQGGKGQGQGSGKSQGQGQGAGSGQGQGSGSGQGQGQGAGSGQGQGSGSGRGGSGAAGRNGTAAGGHNGNQGDRVYVPGSQGNGRSTTTNGSEAPPTGGSYQPLTAVLPSYERNARNELNNGSVPAADQPLVRQYFDRLHHGK